mmetsp:Transcript_2131/g.5406  ORF Transcript_2131/g.5406 Transcript_2131/m.5406 type:complete len:135 (-) Transcript_2131:675-1079(-)
MLRNRNKEETMALACMPAPCVGLHKLSLDCQSTPTSQHIRCSRLQPDGRAFHTSMTPAAPAASPLPSCNPPATACTPKQALSCWARWQVPLVQVQGVLQVLLAARQLASVLTCTGPPPAPLYQRWLVSASQPQC